MILNIINKNNQVFHSLIQNILNYQIVILKFKNNYIFQKIIPCLPIYLNILPIRLHITIKNNQQLHKVNACLKFYNKNIPSLLNNKKEKLHKIKKVVFDKKV